MNGTGIEVLQELVDVDVFALLIELLVVVELVVLVVLIELWERAEIPEEFPEIPEEFAELAPEDISFVVKNWMKLFMSIFFMDNSPK